MKTLIAVILGAGIALSAQAKLPAPPPQSDAEKAAAAEKAKLAAAKENELLGKYQDSAAPNYKKNKGIAAAPAPKEAAKDAGKKK